MKTNIKIKHVVLLTATTGLMILAILIGNSNCYRNTALTDDTKEKEVRFLTIKVDYKEAQPEDTLSLYLLNPIYPYPHINDKGHRVITANEKQGYFTFNIPAEGDFGYFTIMKPRTFTDKGQGKPIMPIINNQFWERGDSILINISHRETAGGIHSTCEFYGNGSEKYKIRDSVLKIKGEGKVFPLYEFDENFDFIANVLIKKKRLAYLENEKHSISELAYESLKADVLYSYSSGFRGLQKYFNDSIKSSFNDVKEDFVRKYEKFSNESKRVKGEDINPEVLSNNPTYLRYLRDKYIADAEIINGSYDQYWVYNRIKSTTTGLAREREVVLLFLQTQRTNKIDEIITDTKSYFQDPYCINFLKNVKNKGIGTKVSDATFYDESGKPINITDYEGKVVLLDFWFNGCGGCMSVYREITSKLPNFFEDDSDFVILSINSDKSKQRWLDGIKLGIYTDSNAKNVYTNGMGFKHPFIIENQIPFCPWMILIDQEGIIRSVDGKELFELETLLEIIEKTLNE
ncbi:redoxin domain-containing protein [Aestuariibaculum sp. M13]|uniref:TlpA family protein disulfide reductase n=1 Tax=Aestuariibaculum sp. M13 TaxID=2967132 RepID=UPI002159DEB2|nr:redoxin domain-containing protein [Aestuariibaculum sp. M13]MCR8667473.1 redoxin domain-containing protein [Aestuariibaculum sp. M13]